MNPKEHLRFVGTHLGMFGLDRGERFERAIAYVSGFDDGGSGLALDGFREWLVLTCKGGDHLHWSGLVRALADASTEGEAGHDVLLSCLFDSLEQFFDAVEADGLETIRLKYEAWQSGDSASAG